FLDLAGHGERENLQTVWRAACRGWIGQAVAHLVIQPIHLIAVDVAFSTQYVAVIETGAGKCPMPGAVDGKATHAARGASAPAGIDAVRCVEPEGLAAGAADLGRLPAVGCARHVAAAIDRILGAGPLFVADMLASLALQTRLPHEVAGKTRCTAALLDKAIHRVAHLPCPVFVMADEHGAITVQQDFRREMQFMLAAEIDRIAGTLGEAEKMAAITRPAGRRILLGMAS